MEIVGSHRDFQLAQIAQETGILRDQLVPSRLAQLHLGRPVGIVNARVDLHAEAREALLLGAQLIQPDGALAEFQAHIFEADLLQEIADRRR